MGFVERLRFLEEDCDTWAVVVHAGGLRCHRLVCHKCCEIKLEVV